MPTEETTYRSSLSDKLDAILEQTIKTNGRVTALEQQLLTLRLWRAYITGGLAVLSVVVLGILIPLASAFIGK